MSSVNASHPGHTRPGVAIIGTGAANQVYLYTLGTTHLIADAAGWFI